MLLIIYVLEVPIFPKVEDLDKPLIEVNQLLSNDLISFVVFGESVDQVLL